MAIAERLMGVSAEVEGKVHSLMLGLGYAMQYTVRKEIQNECQSIIRLIVIKLIKLYCHYFSIFMQTHTQGCQQPIESLPEVEVLIKSLPTRYASFIEMAVLGCSYLGSQNIVIVHQILAKITTIEEEETRKLKEKEEEEKKKKADSEKEGETKKDPAGGAAGYMSMMDALGFGGGGISAQPAPNKDELDNIAKEGKVK